MKARKNNESPNKAVSDILSNSEKPLVAYEILDRLKGQGINAPPTVYRALNKLVKTGAAHRIASNHSYFMCSNDANHDHAGVVFAICRLCNNVDEIMDNDFGHAIAKIKQSSGFTIESEVMEMIGVCQPCNTLKKDS